MSLSRTPLSDLLAEALRLTCRCGTARTFTLANAAEAMPTGATLATLAEVGCDDCGPAGRLASITIIGEPVPPEPEFQF